MDPELRGPGISKSLPTHGLAPLSPISGKKVGSVRGESSCKTFPRNFSFSFFLKKKMFAIFS